MHINAHINDHTSVLIIKYKRQGEKCLQSHVRRNQSGSNQQEV